LKLFWISIFCFFLFPCFALAGDLANRVQRAYSQVPAIEADFVQVTYVELLGREVREEGRIVLARTAKFLIHYKGGQERKYISDGKTLWIWRKGDPKIEVIKDIGENIGREALTFLTGLGELDKEFHIEEKGKDELRLVPRDPRSPFKRLVLLIGKPEALARQVTLFPRSGNKSRYEFTRWEKKEGAPAHLFRRP
jgi:outer membrane lipoprotein-sorting protein